MARNREKNMTFLIDDDEKHLTILIDDDEFEAIIERCPKCGGMLETLFNQDGRNPLRCCWQCEVETSKNVPQSG